MRFNQRSDPRQPCRIPMLTALTDQSDYQEAVASNISRGGICIQAPLALQKNATIYVKPLGVLPDSQASEAFVARVRWVKDPYRQHNLVDVGLQYVTKCMLDDLSAFTHQQRRCDFCNCLLESASHETHDALSLCEACFYNYGVLDDNIIKSGISRFLSGNVL